MNENRIRILAVDDDEDIRELLKMVLEKEGFEVITAKSSRDALEKFNSAIDLVLLDVAMPEEDGFFTCRRIRERSTVPILFLTAKSQEEDKVIGFSSGGDDYLSKPFSKVELVSRIRALLRRCYEYKSPEREMASSQIVRGNLSLDTVEKKTYLDGRLIPLTATEYELLELMVRHPKKVFSAQNLYEFVWNQKYSFADNNIVIVHISNIRKKLGDDPKNPYFIKNMWGRGYYVD